MISNLPGLDTKDLENIPQITDIESEYLRNSNIVPDYLKIKLRSIRDEILLAKLRSLKNRPFYP